MNDVAQLNAALVGRYAVEREIGAGGMATVYLATDLRHDRPVALKVLRPDLGAVLGVDRFLSEIRVTANLQHPNLLPLFDSGSAEGHLFYVMPFVEGESLRARLDREKQLPVDEALRIGSAVASALDYAHRHGVIHRDLKPENILLHEGQPLVADFGIALAVSNAGGGRITQTGLSLGTPQYMSPEQATGDRVIDARTDVYSLGAVMYEMLTGDPPYAGSTSQAVIARLLTERPRTVRATRPSVPPHVEAAVAKALEKLPADRFASAQELADALSGRLAIAAAPPAAGEALAPPPEARLRAGLRRPLVAGALALAALGWGGLAWSLAGRPEAPPRTAVRFPLVLPENEGEIAVGANPFAFAPDGRTVVYLAAPGGGTSRLYARRLDEAGSRALPGTEGAVQQAFSPDGRWLAYVAGGQLLRVGLDAGAPVRVAEVTGPAGLAWGSESLVLGRLSGSLLVVPASGGAPVDLVPLDSAAGETSHRAPVVLGDGETVLYTSWRGGVASARIAVTSLLSRVATVLEVQGIKPLGVVEGLLVYHDARGSLLGVPFDVRRRRVTGGPLPLEDSVSFRSTGAVQAALSHSGSLVYMPASASGERELVVLSPEGGARLVTPLRRRYRDPRYSPDGRRIAVGVETDSIVEIWVYDVLSETLSPLTRGFNSLRLEWSPDGRDLVFSSSRGGPLELWRQPADGSAPAVRVQAAGERGQPVQGLIAPDGGRLIYRTGYRGDDLWHRAWEGDTVSQALAADPSFVERNPSLSPDGRWVAYASNESGAYQVYVRPFPGPGPRYPVTVDGGDAPVWSPDGRRIYYVAGDRFEEALVTTSPEFRVTRRALVAHGAVLDDWHRSYDLAPDGSHFLVVRPVGGAPEARWPVVVHDWAAEVRARVAR